MGLKYREFLEGQEVYGCVKCRSHLTAGKNIMSTSFQGQHGRAYLVDFVHNIDVLDDIREEMMRTGCHEIQSIVCRQCAVVLGWKYVAAHDASQKYKEGKFILEKALIRSVQ